MPEPDLYEKEQLDRKEGKLFVRAVFKHFIGWSSGLVVSVTGFVTQLIKTGEVQWMWWTIAAIGFACSCFYAWRDEHRAIASIEAKLADLRAGADKPRLRVDLRYPQTRDMHMQRGKLHDVSTDHLTVSVTNLGKSSVSISKIEVQISRPDGKSGILASEISSPTLPLPVASQETIVQWHYLGVDSLKEFLNCHPRVIVETSCGSNLTLGEHDIVGWGTTGGAAFTHKRET